jgi:putative transposase
MGPRVSASTGRPYGIQRVCQVWARLRFVQGLPVSRKRILRVMRAHALLSPRRGRQGTPHLHDGTIITTAPNLVWGTDGAKAYTLGEG